MPLPFHLIDGYNLLHPAGFARANYGPGDLERSRVALLMLIAEGLSEDDRRRTTVVFDAIDPPANPNHRTAFREMTVLFAVGYPDADTLVEELLSAHTSPRQLRMVSDDIRLKKSAKRRGSQAVSTDAFLERLKRLKEAKTSRPVQQLSVPETASEEWMRYFHLQSDDTIGLEQIAQFDPAAMGKLEPTTVPKPDVGEERKNSPSQTRNRSAEPAGASNRIAPNEVSDSEGNDDFSYWQAQIEAVEQEERQKSDRRSKPAR